eukprot:Skav212932  [mRNA]  locus=scaffold374:361280:362562:- [translate_table: standard]
MVQCLHNVTLTWGLHLASSGKVERKKRKAEIEETRGKRGRKSSWEWSGVTDVVTGKGQKDVEEEEPAEEASKKAEAEEPPKKKSKKKKKKTPNKEAEPQSEPEEDDADEDDEAEAEDPKEDHAGRKK